jgi:putative NADPH-quinone reductase
MSKHITIIQGHPDPDNSHYCHALAEAYREGAEAGRHPIRIIRVAGLDFPLLRNREDWKTKAPPPCIRKAQEDIAWAEHLVIIYPLWLGTMPAVLKGFLEQALRPEFAISELKEEITWEKHLGGRSARIVVTMGMPALVYRWYFGAHSLKSLERNILKFCGIGPVSESIIGMIEQKDDSRRKKWLERMKKLGKEGK